MPSVMVSGKLGHLVRLPLRSNTANVVVCHASTKYPTPSLAIVYLYLKKSLSIKFHYAINIYNPPPFQYRLKIGMCLLVCTYVHLFFYSEKLYLHSGHVGGKIALCMPIVKNGGHTGPTFCIKYHVDRRSLYISTYVFPRLKYN